MFVLLIDRFLLLAERPTIVCRKVGEASAFCVWFSQQLLRAFVLLLLLFLFLAVPSIAIKLSRFGNDFDLSK